MFYTKNTLKKLKNCYLVLSILAVFTMGNSYAQKKEIDSLKNELNLLRRLPSFQPKDTAHIKLLTNLANKLTYYKPDSLLLLSQEALSLSKATGYTEGEFDSYIGIGRYYLNIGEHTKAIEEYKQARKIGIQQKRKKDLIIVNRALAEAYKYTDNYAKALKNYLKALELAKGTNNSWLQSRLNIDIGILYGRINDFEQALYYFNISKNLNQKINDDLLSAQTLVNLGELHLKQKKYDDAMAYTNSSITLFEEHETYDWLTYAYEIKGAIFLEQKQYKWALFWFRQSQNLFDEKVKDEREEIHLLKSLTKVNLATGKIDLAEQYAIKGFEIAKRHQDKVELKEHAKYLYRINKQKNKYEKALEYNELYKQLSDSIQQNGSRKSMVMYKVDVRHEQQKMALIEENKLAVKKQTNYIYITIGILSILAGITILMLRNQRTQKKLTLELGEKKNDLENQKIELYEINQTKDKLFSIIGHDLRGPIAALQGILQLFTKKEIKQDQLTSLIPKLLGDIDHISFTLNNLLLWGQSQMNGSVTKFSKIHLVNIVKDNINLLSEMADKKSITINNKVSKVSYALADSDQIDIVVRNLLSNAIKFTPNNGEITVNIKDNDTFWELSIKDNGVGIAYDTIKKLFDTNENITTFGTNNEKGTGLGLSLCKEMVENNNGTIWVDSTRNEGSTFFFTVQKFISPTS